MNIFHSFSKREEGWEQSQSGSYFSNHITELYFGDRVPKYHVFENNEDNGWVIGVFLVLLESMYLWKKKEKNG